MALNLAVTFVVWPAIYLVGFAIVFVSIERLWPAVPGQAAWRGGSWIDVALSFLNPVVVHPVLEATMAFAVAAGLAVIGLPMHERLAAAIGDAPFGVQLALGLLVADFAAYWKHRVFHTRFLWPIHALHHSATEIDWLTNERDHPLQLLGTYVAIVPAMAVAGFSPEVISLQALLRRAYSLYTHANVGWSYGPLNRVFVSPALHRWHHARDAHVANKNFAVFFSIFDVIFGTYTFPVGPSARSFGLPNGMPPPATLAAAFWHPFTYWWPRSPLPSAPATRT